PRNPGDVISAQIVTEQECEPRVRATVLAEVNVAKPGTDGWGEHELRVGHSARCFASVPRLWTTAEANRLHQRNDRALVHQGPRHLYINAVFGGKSGH